MKKKTNKTNMIIKGVAIITILGIGYYAGLYMGCKTYNDGIDNLARTGKTITSFVDGQAYVLSVTKSK